MEAKSAQENLILTKVQLKALKKAKQEKKVHGGLKRSSKSDDTVLIVKEQ